MSGEGGLSKAALSKAAKKNLKRRAKKKGEPVSVKPAKKTINAESLVPELKQQLEEAKAAKDDDRVSKLREQIWVLKDLNKGVKTDMPDAVLLPIIASIEALMKEKNLKPEPITQSDPTKRIKNLEKKLEQIKKLKERKANGDTLEAGQIEKLKSEDAIEEELEKLEDLVEKS